MKVIAMYLPQFHRVKENDEWWGEGFTEWTTVKLAKPLYDGHNQPIVPHRERYYNLLDCATMQWQANLMKQYGIDGICMYHYWFRDGRQILEKPAENLLQWKDIDMPFCFCWANETWARTWSAIQDTNVWFGSFAKKTEDGKSILLEQKYGTEEQWMEHFMYLLDFFKDERYIKIEDKPVFMIYRPELMPCAERMLTYWNDLAKKEGFSGMYFICGNKGIRSGIHDAFFDKILLWEPSNGFRKLKEEGLYERKNGVLTVQYDDVWNAVLQKTTSDYKKVFGGFVNYDDTPRRGSSGMLIEGGSPDKFEAYFTELLAKNAVAGNEYVFVNAWNEWGEGMYLEPDEINEMKYLKAVKNAKSYYKKHIEKYKLLQGQQKNAWYSAEGRGMHYYAITDKWLNLRERNINLADYFMSKGYKHLAVYGYGSLAEHLIAELKETEVMVDYIIDRNPANVCANIPVMKMDRNLPEVDIIVITATYSCGSIFVGLREMGYTNVISLEEIIMELV